MGASPKQQDYAPSEAEKASASVAMAEYNHFKKEYDPLLREMRDESKSESAKSTLRGRTNADTMQALTNNMTYGQTQANNLSSDMSQAYQAQLGQANTRAKDIQNKMSTNVLEVLCLSIYLFQFLKKINQIDVFATRRRKS